ncbi:hypothetical protein C8Q80DRAFT_607193 [Daedaleopsis nitida]|nr:hypothetical protein C8Q80DRAFT_607193 [Daedaleopsis nitida]
MFLSLGLVVSVLLLHLGSCHILTAPHTRCLHLSSHYIICIDSHHVPWIFHSSSVPHRSSSSRSVPCRARSRLLCCCVYLPYT